MSSAQLEGAGSILECRNCYGTWSFLYFKHAVQSKDPSPRPSVILLYQNLIKKSYMLLFMNILFNFSLFLLLLRLKNLIYEKIEFI